MIQRACSFFFLGGVFLVFFFLGFIFFLGFWFLLGFFWFCFLVFLVLHFVSFSLWFLYLDFSESFPSETLESRAIGRMGGKEIGMQNCCWFFLGSGFLGFGFWE